VKAPYYTFRPEIAKLVPADARTVIDVGCGDGALGRGLKRARPALQVRGIETDAKAAAAAAVGLDDVLCGDACLPLPDRWPSADCAIFADVLEHMTDPWDCLRIWRQRLRKGATIVVSVPNMLHFSALRELRRGRWDYRDSGILDKTHLRFFTRDTSREMIVDAGFEIEHFERVWLMPEGLTRYLGRAARRLEGSAARPPPPGLRWADFYSLQYLYVAR
jgi:SAM-dependent methyltransferase